MARLRPDRRPGAGRRVDFAPLPDDLQDQGARPARPDRRPGLIDRLRRAVRVGSAARLAPPLGHPRAAVPSPTDASPTRRTARPAAGRSATAAARARPGLPAPRPRRRAAGAGDPGADHRLDHPGGVAGLPGQGLELLHLDALGAQRRRVRRAGLHLRHARRRRSSPSCIAVPVSLGIALFLTEVAPRAAAPAGRLRASTCWPPSRRWCSACGASSSCCASRWATGLRRDRRRPSSGIPVLGTLFGEPVSGLELHHRRAHPGPHDHADHHLVTREVFDTVPDAPAGGGAGARRHPLGDDQGRGASPRQGRHRRRGDARPRPGDGRDDRRRPGHRLEPADHRQPVRPGRRHAGGDRQPVRRGRRAPTGRRSSASASCCSSSPSSSTSPPGPSSAGP